jgi:hypothetical protein
MGGFQKSVLKIEVATLWTLIKDPAADTGAGAPGGTV